MNNNFIVSENYDGIDIETPSNGMNETISRSSINVLRGYRSGFGVYRHKQLFAICYKVNDLDIEFIKPLKLNQFNEFNTFLKNINITHYNLWDIHGVFEKYKLNKVDEVQLMSSDLVSVINKENISINLFQTDISSLERLYSNSFKVKNKIHIANWSAELTNEPWFRLSDVYIVGYESPAAFLIIRKRSADIIEIFLFGIKKEFQSRGLSAELFAHLMYEIRNHYDIDKINIQIWVHTENKAAYRLYAKHNFKSIRIRKKYLINLQELY